MYHIIVNPASRSGRGLRIWEEAIKPALTEKAVSYQVYFSKEAGEVTLLTQKIIATHFSKSSDEKPCRLIILGGDGTVNEALQGIAPSRNVIVGYIPTGSSNDLARDLGISKDPIKALSRILDAKTKPEYIKRMDRGIVRTDDGLRSFAVSCGIGYDAAVCEEVMHSKLKGLLNKIGLGKLTYLGIALKLLFSTKPVSCTLYLDDKEPIHIKKLLFIASMTHRFEGGGFKFCPMADYADGLFDLCVVGNIPKLVILFALPTAFFGKHLLVPGINHYRAARIRITTNRPLWVHTDGEVIGRVDGMEISCIRQDIQFIS
ncbi:MAG: diacylglycerol kinase family lipid kinase [Lachnospiraceae bacterium]|nr:diacylglycerol kinase family lipid kinase [Lachnospiraceae bacterium]